jgi:hypothetical protein
MLMGKPRHPKLSFNRMAGDKGEVCTNDIETWRLGFEISADKLSAGKIHWSIPISSPNLRCQQSTTTHLERKYLVAQISSENLKQLKVRLRVSLLSPSISIGISK